MEQESSSGVKAHLRDEAIGVKGNEGRDYKRGLKGEERSQVGKRQLKESNCQLEYGINLPGYIKDP